MGLDLLEHGTLSTTDPLLDPHKTFPFTNHEWLGGLVMALAYRIAGTLGLAVLKAMLVGATFYLVAGADPRQHAGRSTTHAGAGRLGGSVDHRHVEAAAVDVVVPGRAVPRAGGMGYTWHQPFFLCVAGDLRPVGEPSRRVDPRPRGPGRVVRFHT